jgi:hypothetical protein
MGKGEHKSTKENEMFSMTPESRESFDKQLLRKSRSSLKNLVEIGCVFWAVPESRLTISILRIPFLNA